MPKMDFNEWSDRMDEGKVHIEHSMEGAMTQHHKGRWFFYEHK